MTSKSHRWFLRLATLGIAFIALVAYRQVLSDTKPNLAEVVAARLKDKFNLHDVVAADRNERSIASGVIKEENQKEGYLLLLTNDICKTASGIVFVDPYNKVKLEEPADCDGEKIDRYRVQQLEHQ
jgi:hypothetical protein